MNLPNPYAANRLTVDGMEVFSLEDAAHGMEVRVVPSIGNMAYRIEVRGRNILWFPYSSPAELREKPVLCGVPLLAPWANRIDGDAYWAAGRRYTLNPGLENVRRDNDGKPIHGLLNFSPLWSVVALEAGSDSASLTSQLEFWKYPPLMAQFPFAHTIRVTYRLAAGSVEVETVVVNHALEAMPVAIGFHPFFRLGDAARDQWRVHVAARERLLLNAAMIPTGRSEANPFADSQPLDGIQLDDVFGSLVRDADGIARFWCEGVRERVTVAYGPRYSTAVVFAPKGRDFLCLEPMSAVTNAFNLAHAGVFPNLQTIPPGGEWRESFRIVPSGF
ncbi:MAG: aldose 1-epimerase [Bryobacteraceae bacterium]|jgi:aldose 1-epimerase